MHKKP